MEKAAVKEHERESEGDETPRPKLARVEPSMQGKLLQVQVYICTCTTSEMRDMYMYISLSRYSLYCPTIISTSLDAHTR